MPRSLLAASSLTAGRVRAAWRQSWGRPDRSRRRRGLLWLNTAATGASGILGGFAEHDRFLPLGYYGVAAGLSGSLSPAWLARLLSGLTSQSARREGDQRRRNDPGISGRSAALAWSSDCGAAARVMTLAHRIV